MVPLYQHEGKYPTEALEVVRRAAWRALGFANAPMVLLVAASTKTCLVRRICWYMSRRDLKVKTDTSTKSFNWRQPHSTKTCLEDWS